MENARRGSSCWRIEQKRELQLKLGPNVIRSTSDKDIIIKLSEEDW